MHCSKDSSDKIPSTPILLAFILSTLFLIYIGLISQMVIVQDAMAFQETGKMIYQQGWQEYFRTGPNREPFAPLVIALSMNLADQWHLPYQDIQRFIQIFFLILAQFLSYKILKRMQINPYLMAIVILSMGFLPGIVNSAMSSYSEVFAYPFVLGIIYLAVNILKLVFKPFSARIILDAFLLGVLFVALTSVKAIGEFLAPLFLGAYLLLAVMMFVRKKYQSFFNLIIFILICALTFSIPVFLFKSLNKKYNGKFTVTNRGAFMFYGNTMRHMEGFSGQRVLVGITSSMGSGEQVFCHKLFGKEACAFWDFRNSDAYAHDKINQLIKEGMGPEQIDRTLVRLAIGKILTHPLQYASFAMSEALTMIFFKSAEVSYVAYPNWLDKIYDSVLLQYSLNFLSAFLNLLALLYAGRFVWKNGKKMLLRPEQSTEQKLFLFPIFIFAILFIALHSLISVQTRYCLPIVPLYLTLIAFMLQNVFKKT